MDFTGHRSLRDLWDERVSARGDEEFLAYESADGETETHTYRAFDVAINRTASALADHWEVRHGDAVAIHLLNGPAYLRVWFALAKLGALSVHSNVNHAVREVNYTLDRSDATLAVTQPRYADDIRAAAEGTDVEAVLLTETDGGTDSSSAERDLSVLAADADPEPPQVNLVPDDDAQILFTSGTTGDPKGVVMTQANLMYAGERQTKHLLMRPGDRNSTALPLYHVNGQTSALSALTAGATFVLFEKYATATFIDQVRAHQATITSLIDTQVRALLDRDAVDDDNDLRVITYAINITDEEKRRFEDAVGAPLLNGYGLSEAMSLVTQAPIHGDRRWPSVGLPTFDREVHLVDDEGDPVETGETGEIAVEGVRGRSLFRGYYGMPGETAETFTKEGWLLTGDVGRFDEAGYLYFVDRKKNIIKTRGENVSEQEVENVLETHDGVGEAAVVGVPHEIYGEVVKAYVKRSDPGLTADALMEHAEANFADFKVPAEMDFVDDFPRMTVGKIAKKQLRDEE
jgi:crotonobetaine/carnitine-CoA ligase